jgi:predicted ATPase
MIKSLFLEDFTCFTDTKFEFCSGINVLIGQNGTGKTHILKILASILKANETSSFSLSQSKEKLESLLAENLVSYFKPEQLGRLTHRKQGRTSTNINLKIKNKNFSFSFSSNSKSNVKLDKYEELGNVSSLYLPPREMFSTYEGFESLVKNREVSFDATYVYLVEALKSLLLKGPRYEEIKKIIQPLEDVLGAKVIKKDGRFYLKDSSGMMEAHLVAEGLRKIASVMYLIANGTLTKKSILFWDEPESNLNPKLIAVITKLLIQLSQNGVQIFIATHDYLLTHQLSLHAEYKDIDMLDTPPIKFFCINKDSAKGSLVQSGNTLAEIDNNPILEEYAAFYDLERSYFDKSIKTDK